jgi:RNA polymerase sigma-70 factor (ECF subfamily)
MERTHASTSPPRADSDESKASSALSEASDPSRWLDDHGDALYGYALARVRDRHVAEEIVQETLLAALGAGATFAGQSSLRTWLIGIMRHKISDWVRRANQERDATAFELNRGDEALVQFVDRQFTKSGKWKNKPRNWGKRASDPTAMLEEAEFRHALRECLKKLSPNARDAIVLVEREPSSIGVVGKILGVTSTHLSVILHRARTALRSCIEDRWFGDR